ncbi:pyrroline-5-carboxylate reductase [Colwellia sp. MEBiC06753]
MSKVAFIGAGNMNRAIIQGLVKSGFNPNDIIVSNPSEGKRIALANEFGIGQTSSNIEAAGFADYVVLGVKPHFIEQVCQDIAEKLTIDDKCFISVAAGTTMSQIQAALGGNKAVIRTMPNTPSQLGLGVSGAFPSPEVSSEQKAFVDKLIQATGIAKWLNSEAEIDHIIAVTGSAPAYFFLFMEAIADEAVRLGFSEQDARAMVQQTALGAAQMVIENSDTSIAQLRANVTSKGGTTHEAVTTFIDGGLPELVSKAMQAAISRAKEMANK